MEARVAAYPETVFPGKVGAILPEVNAATRTLRARIELSNPGARLKPGMFATIAFKGEPARETVLVPSEAVIRTGERSVVILETGKGSFRAAAVEVGLESAGQSEIRKGLKSGDKVVLSGQFLIDSEASLSASLARLDGGAETAQAPPAKDAVHKGQATVLDVDRAKGSVALDHGPIPSMQWPAMKMGFLVEDKAQLANLKKGDAVEFEFRSEPNKDGDYVVTRIAPGARK